MTQSDGGTELADSEVDFLCDGIIENSTNQAFADLVNTLRAQAKRYTAILRAGDAGMPEEPEFVRLSRGVDSPAGRVVEYVDKLRAYALSLKADAGRWARVEADKLSKIGWYYRAGDDCFIRAEIVPLRQYVAGIVFSNDPRHYRVVDTLVVDGSTYSPDWGRELYGPIALPNPPISEGVERE